MGAHTEWGGYVIDYRKTRNFNCPDFTGSKVSGDMFPSLPILATSLAGRPTSKQTFGLDFSEESDLTSDTADSFRHCPN